MVANFGDCGLFQRPRRAIGRGRMQNWQALSQPHLVGLKSQPIIRAEVLASPRSLADSRQVRLNLARQRKNRVRETPQETISRSKQGLWPPRIIDGGRQKCRTRMITPIIITAFFGSIRGSTIDNIASR